MKKWLGLAVLLLVATMAFADPVPVSVTYLTPDTVGFPYGAIGPYYANVTDPSGTSTQPVICFSQENEVGNFTDGLKYSINTVGGLWGLSTFDYNVLGFLADELFAAPGTADIQRAIWYYAGFVTPPQGYANWIDQFSAADQTAIANYIADAIAGVQGGYTTGDYFLFAPNSEPGFGRQPLIERAPEPTSMLLLGTGILSMAGALRRKMAK